MNFEQTERSIELQKKVDDFMQRHIFPIEKEVYEYHRQNLWQQICFTS